MLDGRGGNRKKCDQQCAGDPTKPGNATFRFCSLPRKCASRTVASRAFSFCLWIALATSSGTKYGSVRGGLFPFARHALYISTASPPVKLSVFALGSSPRH